MADETIYEVYAIRFATNPARLRGQNFIGDPKPLDPSVMDFMCWVIVGGGRAIMIDTGTSRTIIEKQGLSYIRCPTEALTALGLDAATLSTVILTHLHYDHIGNLDKFPTARFHVQAVEMQYATGPDMQNYFLRRPYGRVELNQVLGLLHDERLDIHGATVELADGVSLHLVGGHTAGQEIVRVRTQRGWVVLASDALHYYEELERTIPFAVAQDVSKMLSAHAVIRSLADSDDHIVPAHDPLVLQRYPAATADLAGFVVRLDVAPVRLPS
jgi:glyoxylase-like metal-dependent hydrolase (beta-lactamase superfamily II)